MMGIVQLLRRSALYVVLCLLATGPALAEGQPDQPGPNGINIGFDFNWNNGPGGDTASFIGSAPGASGASLVNCILPSPGTVTSSASACDFAFTYSIADVAQTSVQPGGVYETWPAGGTGTGEFCGTPTNPQSAPLTLFNCQNRFTFGQVFYAHASGELSNVTMRMTCLNPAGVPLTGVSAAIYQTNGTGTAIPGTPLAIVNLDMSACPTLQSWTTPPHQFTSDDFATIPLNFSGVTVTSGNIYGVFISAPGFTLPGVAPPPPAPTLSEWGAIGFAAALLALGIWKLRRRLAA